MSRKTIRLYSVQKNGKFGQFVLKSQGNPPAGGLSSNEGGGDCFELMN